MASSKFKRCSDDTGDVILWWNEIDHLPQLRCVLLLNEEEKRLNSNSILE